MKEVVENKYDHKQIEAKWQKRWEEKKVYLVDTSQEPGARSPDFAKATTGKQEPGKGKYYCLDMLPYPSGAAMHVGHLKGYVGSEVIARFMRMKEYDVVHPMGWDSFGLPAESYALKVNRHPKELNKELVEKFKEQLNLVGFSYDWSKEVNTSDPEYIKWTQWWFLLLYKKGLAYRAEAPVNWCPGCQTVLANEQVVDGKCERCGSVVVKKNLKQWFFKITAYADRLLEDLNKLDWPESTKMGQRNWIGKSQGINITYEIEGRRETVTCFTTTPVNFGASFIVLSPEHPLVYALTTEENKEAVEKYVNQVKKESEMERLNETKEKTGVFTGSHAINHLTGEKLPIWVADFVLMGVGTGAVQGCPGHDRRDFEFAKKYNLPIKRVVAGENGEEGPIEKAEQVEEKGSKGKMVNSDFLNGMEFGEAMQKTMDYFEEKGWGKRVVNYKLRDWLVSRQRYWGAPIPIVYCEKCGEVPLELKDLPLELPDIEDIRPKGKAPLASDPEFVNTICPKCGGPATRETDTMDGFVDNSWYYYRYLDPHNDQAFCGGGQLKHWMPVDLYVGGAEHTVGHLTYSRFFTKVLFDEGMISFDEPFLKLRHQGLISGEDGRKMSKRWGNVVGPEEVVAVHGADALRLYEMFMGPFSDSLPWSSRGLVGCRRFLEKIWGLYHDKHKLTNNSSPELVSGLQELVKKVGDDIDSLKFNTAIAAMMEWLNKWKEAGVQLSVDDSKKFLLILAPFAPHITEELWSNLSFDFSVHQQKWPEVNLGQLLQKDVMIPVQVNGKVRSQVAVASDRSKDEEYVKTLAVADEQVKKWIEGPPSPEATEGQVKKIKKVIFVPGRLVNVVTN